MSAATDSSDKLRALRERVASAATPAERVKATLLLAEELWYRDPVAARPLFEQVAADAAGTTQDRQRAVSILSEMLRRAGDLEGSARHAELLMKASATDPDRRLRAVALNLIGLIHQERGEFDRAVECFEEFLQISRETGFGNGEQSALNQLAGVYGVRGELDKALACYRQSLELSTKNGDTFGRAIELHNIGWALEAMGRWTEATEHFHRAIALCEEHGFNDLLLSVRKDLGELALKRSDYENAAFIFRMVIAGERKEQQAGTTLREALSNLGWTHFRAGDLALAEETLAEAARLCEAAEDRHELATVGFRRAEVALAQGRLDEACELLDEAARHAADLNLRREQGHVLRVQARLAAARGQAGAALDLFDQAEATLEPLGDTYELALTRLQCGRLLAETGRQGQALPRLQAAARTFRRLAVVAEAEEAADLLYGLERHTDRGTALIEALFALAPLGLAPERFVERVLSVLCDNLQFEQGAVLVGGRPVALKGAPDLTTLPRVRSSPVQTDVALLMPIRQDRRLLGHLWLQHRLPLAARVEPKQLELVSSVLAPSLSKLQELRAAEDTHIRHIPGLRFRGVVGRNREVLEVLNLVPCAAETGVPVLIRGESGTGKELVARALHESGPRADHPFITVNCAAVPESLLEAEFFGVEVGAATGVVARPGKFELAGSGTIFLDEIGDMSPILQAKMLRVIEDKEVTRVGGADPVLIDVRVIAATNMDLDRREREGLFRRDLLYRLNTVQFVLPPLRHRREDMEVLVNHFIARTAQQYNRPARRASDEVLALFDGFTWPGNIRQLQHVVERAVIVGSTDTIEIHDLPFELREARSGSAAQPSAFTRDERRRVLDDAERELLLDALTRANWDMSAAAKITGYSRSHFYRLIQKHQINPPE